LAGGYILVDSQFHRLGIQEMKLLPKGIMQRECFGKTGVFAYSYYVESIVMLWRAKEGVKRIQKRYKKTKCQARMK
jgi:hypothetical protein